MIRRKLTLFAVLSTLVLLLVGASLALAAPPAQVTVPYGGTFLLAECDGFDILDTYSGTLTFQDFYDNDGNLLRSTLHAKAHDRIYNSVTGFEVSNTFAYNETVNADATEFFIRGVGWNITVPGYGIVYFDAGLGIFAFVEGEFVEVKLAGNFQLDEAALCAAMDQ